MKTKLIIASLFTLCLSTQAFAHDGEKHQGKPIEGKVTSLSDSQMKVATDKGDMMVSFETNTNFQIGMDGQKGQKSDLKQGDFVMVEGTKAFQQKRCLPLKS